MPSRVVCVGEILRECLLAESSFPGVNETRVERFPPPVFGGSALNICWYLSGLHHDVEIVGSAAAKDLAHLEAQFSDRRWNADGLHLHRGDTDLLVSYLGAETHRSVYFSSAFPESFLSGLPERLKESEILLLNGGRSPELRAAYLALARSYDGGQLVYHPSYSIYEYDRHEIGELVERADTVVVNQSELEFLAAKLGLEGADRVRLRPEQVLLNTLGPNGVRLVHRDRERAFAPPRKRKGIFVGAGDAFLAGFVHARLLSEPLDEAIRYGQVLASRVVDSGRVRVVVAVDELAAGVERWSGRDS